MSEFDEAAARDYMKTVGGFLCVESIFIDGAKWQHSLIQERLAELEQSLVDAFAREEVNISVEARLREANAKLTAVLGGET